MGKIFDMETGREEAVAMMCPGDQQMPSPHSVDAIHSHLALRLELALAVQPVASPDGDYLQRAAVTPHANKARE
ncbi:hypothetical protein KSF73_00075 [Burkholderiaceae bacterium DAT-1]|nr:hypothetical protein [Burkholderiaceae bacterium DAT-1]